METSRFGREPIVHKYLQSSFDFISEMEHEQTFTIVSPSPIINDVEAKIHRTTRGYGLEVGQRNYVTERNEVYEAYRNKGDGLFDKLILRNNTEEWILPEGVSSSETSIIGGETKAEIWQIEKGFDTTKPLYHRLVLANPLYYGTITKHIASERVQVGSTYRGGGFINIMINEKMFNLYDYQTAIDGRDSNYYFIDSVNEVTAHEFEKAIAAILYSAAFITGELPRNEFYITQAEDSFFYAITGAQFRCIEESVDSRMEVVSPRTMQMSKIAEYNKGYTKGYIKPEVFSTLATKAFNDARMLRALKIVIESGKYPLEIRGATYSVALETVKNIVLENFSDKVTPIKEKAIAKVIISEIKKITTNYGDEYYNDKKAVISRIENINQPTNSAGFTTCFQQVEFKLSTADSKVLNNRNDFLHGRLPFEDEFKNERNHELQFVVYKYHFLLSVLILKLCGYSGYIKDNSKFYDVIVRGTTNYDEPLFRLV